MDLQAESTPQLLCFICRPYFTFCGFAALPAWGFEASPCATDGNFRVQARGRCFPILLCTWLAVFFDASLSLALAFPPSSSLGRDCCSRRDTSRGRLVVRLNAAMVFCNFAADCIVAVLALIPQFQQPAGIARRVTTLPVYLAGGLLVLLLRHQCCRH